MSHLYFYHYYCYIHKSIAITHLLIYSYIFVATAMFLHGQKKQPETTRLWSCEWSSIGPRGRIGRLENHQESTAGRFSTRLVDISEKRVEPEKKNKKEMFGYLEELFFERYVTLTSGWTLFSTCFWNCSFAASWLDNDCTMISVKLCHVQVQWLWRGWNLDTVLKYYTFNVILQSTCLFFQLFMAWVMKLMWVAFEVIFHQSSFHFAHFQVTQSVEVWIWFIWNVRISVDLFLVVPKIVEVRGNHPKELINDGTVDLWNPVTVTVAL